jgi:general secretion pathway protein G
LIIHASEINELGSVKIKARGGFTLVELMIVIALLGTLIAIAVPNYIAYKDRTRNKVAIAEISMLSKEIASFQLANQRLPNDMNELSVSKNTDPWGNPYQYKTVAGTPPGQLRKDRFMVPVNTDYDLYSMGKDGSSSTPFTAAASRDDIVRANDGGFIGLVSEY